jgi:seryl-tRNA synthetase
MTGARTSQRFDLRKVGEGGVRAIMDGLRLDREHVSGIELDDTTGELLVEMTGPEAREHVESFVASMAQTHRLVARKILMENHAREPRIRDIDAALAQSEDLQLLGEGLTGLRGQTLALFRFFEREFAEMARDFDAEENHYPVMVPGEVLAEVGYFDHFPQHVTFCSHLAASLPLLESVAADARSGRHGLVESLGGRLDRPRHVLTPGVCLPCYRQQSGVVLGPGEVRTLTMQNHVFRYEGANFRPLSRGWDFTVRDIVFFGSGGQLEGLRREVMERAMTLCEELDLEVTIELAHDPFFLDASRDKAVYQRMGEVKYELLFPLPHRREMLAASSFNLHRDFYTSIYDTRLTDGGLAESACMGFGLERWLYGFLSQKGFDHRGWPRRVAERLQAPC